MKTAFGISAYKKVSLETSIQDADPHKLIAMLFEGALAAIAKAKNEILQKDTAAKGKSISHAIAIIGEGLNASLDKNVGGELAPNLSALYDYMVHRLVAANLHNDAEALDEVARLLTELQGAWNSIRDEVIQSSAPAPSTASTYAHG